LKARESTLSPSEDGAPCAWAETACRLPRPEKAGIVNMPTLVEGGRCVPGGRRGTHAQARKSNALARSLFFSRPARGVEERAPQGPGAQGGGANPAHSTSGASVGYVLPSRRVWAWPRLLTPTARRQLLFERADTRSTERPCGGGGGGRKLPRLPLQGRSSGRPPPPAPPRATPQGGHGGGAGRRRAG